MTDKATLLFLAKRVEELDGPCREVDAEIAIAVRTRRMMKRGVVPEWFWSNFTKWEASDNGRVIAIHCGEERGANFQAVVYTSSIDHAMTLVPDWADITIGNHSTEICRPKNGRMVHVSGADNLYKMAVHITAACLRAMAEEAE